jgi:hypothetical protein
MCPVEELASLMAVTLPFTALALGIRRLRLMEAVVFAATHVSEQGRVVSWLAGPMSQSWMGPTEPAASG